MPDIFLSYSREDQATARRFAEGFASEGFSVWWDQALSAGEAFDKVTEQALEDARAVVVLWSMKSVDSRWVRAEATQAQGNNRLVPVMIEPARRPIMFELTHTADLSGWNGDPADERWRTLIAGLRRFVGEEETSVTGTRPTSVAGAATAAPQPRTGSRKLPVWAAVVAAVAVVVGLWQLADRPTAPKVAAGHEVSIAVLPFTDMSPQRDQAYFADGVAEEILNSLARIPDPTLKVISRNSAFVFRDAQNLKEVGATLGVDHVLEGSVRKAGEQLRITAQLIHTKTDAHLWSKTYDRPLADVFAVQEDVARSVAEALQVSLGVGLGQRPGMTRSVGAYDAFLAALAIPRSYTRDGELHRIDLLQQATKLDPSFAWAWSELGRTYQEMPNITGEDAKGLRQKANAAFSEYDRLLPDSPATHWRLTFGSIAQGRWKEAAGHLKQGEAAAAKASGGAATATGTPIPAVLMMVGKTAEALPLLEQVKARDPLDQSAAFALAWAYGSARKFPAAFAEFERGYQLKGPEQFRIRSNAAQIAMGARDRVQLLRWLDAAVALERETPGRDFHARMKASMDHPADALAYLREYARSPSMIPAALSGVAQWTAWFGDTETALETVRTGFQRGPVPIMSYSIWGPAMRDVRRLPAFKQLMRDHGFVDYWREYGWGDYCKPIGADDFECQ
jgi:TolB-like protein